MGNSLMKVGGSNARGIVPAVASAIVPGLGQLVNGQTDKAIGVFVVWALAGVSFLGWIPLIGSLAALVAGGTWVYGVADGFLTARKRTS